MRGVPIRLDRVLAENISRRCSTRSIAHPELMETLEGYIATNLNRRVTARTLYVHTNTVDYRLKRITHLTGFDPTQATGLWSLRSALVARSWLPKPRIPRLSWRDRSHGLRPADRRRPWTRVVSTLRADGSIQSSLVNAGVLKHPETGEQVVGMVVRGGTRKLDNLRVRNRMTVVARVGRRWAAAEGPVWVVGPDDPHPDVDADQLRRLLREVFHPGRRRPRGLERIRQGDGHRAPRGRTRRPRSQLRQQLTPHTTVGPNVLFGGLGPLTH